jgi:mono/diheme cytochrome c family protein
MRTGFASARFLILTALLLAQVLSAFAQARQSGGPSSLWPGPSIGWNLEAMNPAQRQRMMRQWTFMNKGVSEKYLTATNDVGYTTRTIAQGGPLYVTHCLKCHGETGLGNGELAQDLTPSPALLAYLVQQPIAVDQYLLWTISEGGKQFDTAMPGFRDVLTQKEIWQIIAYLRAGFPQVEGEESQAETGTAPPATTDEPKPK